MIRGEDGITLTEKEKEELLSLARQGIIAAVKGIADVDKLVFGREIIAPALKQARGIFVTLKQKGTLRGCIGTIQTEEPLYRAVVEAAISSAVRDPRFLPLTEEEIDATTIEISVLSSLRVIEKVEEIVVGRHGLYIRKGLNAGLLLPQVASEWGWTRGEFLEQCCRKAGLNLDAWQEDDTEVMIFSAFVFGEGRNA